jgi:hypothetical protein
METLTILNVIANCLIVATLLSVIFKIFGSPSNPIWDNSLLAWISKLGLSLTVVGCIMNILTLSTPPVTEVLLNMGLSLSFGWLVWFNHDEAKSKKDTKKMSGYTSKIKKSSYNSRNA